MQTCLDVQMIRWFFFLVRLRTISFAVLGVFPLAYRGNFTVCDFVFFAFMEGVAGYIAAVSRKFSVRHRNKSPPFHKFPRRVRQRRVAECGGITSSTTCLGFWFSSLTLTYCRLTSEIYHKWWLAFLPGVSSRLSCSCTCPSRYEGPEVTACRSVNDGVRCGSTSATCSSQHH